MMLTETRKRPAVLAAFAAMTLATTAAQAAVMLSFATDATTYDAAPGATLNVPVYLVETLTEGSPSRLAAEEGLFSVGFRAEREPGAAPTAAAFTGVTGNAALFDGQRVHAFTDALASVDQFQDDNFGVGAPPLPDALGRLLVGTLTLVAPSEAGVTTSFILGDFGPADQTVTYAFGTLDADIAGGSFSVTATAVPEPALSTGMLVGAASLARRRRRA